MIGEQRVRHGDSQCNENKPKIDARVLCFGVRKGIISVVVVQAGTSGAMRAIMPQNAKIGLQFA
jgi:hypothetical protein